MTLSLKKYKICTCTYNKNSYKWSQLVVVPLYIFLYLGNNIINIHWKSLSVKRKFCHSTKWLNLYHFVLCTWCFTNHFRCLKFILLISYIVSLYRNDPTPQKIDPWLVFQTLYIYIAILLLIINRGLGLWCLMALSIIFQLYRSDKFYWWKETRVSGENQWHWPAASHWQSLSHTLQ